MRKQYILLLLVTGLFCQSPSQLRADDFEDAFTAVSNMKVGWNLGNTLDSNSGDTLNMWIEKRSSRRPVDYETAWGQPQATRALIHMFKEAGFNAIRVPVTWYPHYGTVTVNDLVWNMSSWQGYSINTAWMKRVKEIVEYVIDEGMYCILNVHHDTGAASTAWLVADEQIYNAQKYRFEQLWTKIALEFKDYDERLLFEGYNEMLDTYRSWCFASFNAPNSYNASVATSAYNAINSYAQSFVTKVRNTGGNNSQRNLIVSTYGACCGEGSWNSHLLDPLKNMKLPTDKVDGHLIFEVHTYPDVSNLSSVKSSVRTMINNLKTHLVSKGAPVIFGEWGSSGVDEDDYSKRHDNLLAFARYFVEQATAAGMGTFYWMGLSDGSDRSAPKWTQEDLKDEIIKGYYGEGGYIPDIAGDVNGDGTVDINDVVAVINHMAGTSTYDKSDVNGDKEVNINDVVSIINIMAGNT